MAGKKLRRLSRLRVLLAVLAVILFAAVCFTGGMLCFINHSLAEDPGGPPDEIITEPEEPSSSEDTQPSEEEKTEPDLDAGKVGGETDTAALPVGCQHVFVQKVAERYLKSAANCASPAVYHESCSRCGATGTGTFTTGDKNPDKHTSLSYGDWGMTQTEHWRTCTCAGCGYENTERVPHTWGNPDKDGVQRCTACQAKKPDTGGGNTGDGNTNAGEGNASAGGGNSNVGEGNTNTGDGNASAGGGNASAGGGNSNVGEGNTNAGEGNTNAGEGNASAGGGNSNVGEGNTNAGEGNTNAGEGNASAGGGNSNIGEGNNKSGAKTPKPNRLAPPTHFALKPVRKLNAVDATSVSAEDTADGTETALVSQGATVSSDGSAAGKLIHLLGLDDENADLEAGRTLYLTLFLICIVLLAADVVGIVILSGRIRRGRRIEPISVVPKTQSLKRGTAGFDFAKVHGQGARRYQQDSHGMTPVMNGEGVFAIVADGMGGLSGGEQVSQQIVMQALNHMADITSAQVKIALPEMLSRVNGAVNKMLGPDGLYKSGSTLVAVLVVRDRLRWISVGDSRIYLYRDGWMNQLTQDHDLLQEWMPDILSGKRSYAEALADPEGKKLTSFIGMGELKYIDSCTSPIRILPGDRIVLMSDGVYNAVPAETMADILRKNPDVQRAAGMLHKAVRAAANPHQDNYTAEILAF